MRLFGTDGVRGIVNKDLDIFLATKIGVSAAYVLGKNKKIKVVIGRDTRISGEMLSFAVTSGLLSMGAEVIDLGIVPTPLVSYLIQKYNADMGVMISASHNPSEYNGIKLFNNLGMKLSDEIEDEIEANLNIMPDKEIGSYCIEENACTDYINHLKSTVSLKGNLKIVVDCANGSASTTAPTLFKELGFDPIIINNKYDGLNINYKCGSTHLEMLKEEVLKNKADLGIAYDGDADRCLLIDEDGNTIDGDTILAINSLYLKENYKLKNNTLVATVMSNLGLRNFCKKHDINFVSTKVGDRYVLENMIENDYILGGEQSGHIIFKNDANTGDGELTSIKTLEILENKNISLSELSKIITIYPQVLINVEVTKEIKENYKNDTNLNNLITSIEEELKDNGRVLIRPSGTENKIRIMLEGTNIEDITKKANIIKEAIENIKK